MTSDKLRTFGLILFFLLLVSLPRLTHLGGYVIVDEADRWRWAEDFTRALYQRDLKATRVGDGYPGIVPIWAETAWIFTEAARLSWQTGNKLDEAGLYHLMHQGERIEALSWQRFPIVILNIALSLTLILFTWRLFGAQVGFIAGVLIALDPFYLSDSRVNRAEAVITGLMTLTILSLIAYARTPTQRRFLVLSAIFGGLSLLTKIQALVIFPAVALILGLIAYQHYPKLRLILSSLSQDFGLWLLGVALTWIILWPAMWVIPIETLTLVYNYATRKAGAEGVNLFFWGQTYQDTDPGLLFYPFVMLMRLTPIALIGLLGFGVYLYHHRAHLRQLPHTPSLYLLIYIIVYGLAMSSGSHKQDRYLLPIFPALDILASLGLVHLATITQGRLGRPLPATLLLVLLGLIQGLTLYPHHPYYYSYFNPLLGGGSTAVKTLRVGWGEGMDQVGEYLAAKPHSRDLIVSTRFTHNMPAFKGETISLLPDGRWTQADYIVLYIQQVQRQQEPSPEFLAYFANRPPEKVITIGGIDYAKIYPIPFKVAANPQISRRENQLALLGYQWEGATLRLWWENQGLTAPSTLTARLTHPTHSTPWVSCPPDLTFQDIASRRGAYVESLCRFDLSGLSDTIYTLEVGLSSNSANITPIPLPEGQHAATLTAPGHMTETPLPDQLQAIIDQALPPTATPQQRFYNQKLHLAGYQLTPAKPQPGDMVEVTLYWQRISEILQPLHLTVQLADSRLLPLGRDDLTLPVDQWWPYTVMSTQHRFKLAADLSPPLAAQLEATLYNKAQVALTATDLTAQPLDPTVARLTIWPRPSITPTYTSTPAFWQGGLELLGYQLAQNQITLYWQTTHPMTTSYMVFVHALDSSGQIISQHDSLPRQGAYPTPWWQPHLLIADDHPLPLPPEVTQLAIGLYDATSLVRLPLIDGTDHIKIEIKN